MTSQKFDMLNEIVVSTQSVGILRILCRVCKISKRRLAGKERERRGRYRKLQVGYVKPNTHRRRRRDETVLSRRVGGVYMNSQLAHDDCRRIRRCERSRWS